FEEISDVRVPAVGFCKQGLRDAMPLLVKIGGIARFAIALQLHANDSPACRNHSGNDVSIGLFAASVEDGMFGARVLIEEKVVAALIFDGLADEIMNLLRREGRLGVLPVLMSRLAWRQRGGPGSVKSHASSQNGQQAKAKRCPLSHPISSPGGAPMAGWALHAKNCPIISLSRQNRKSPDPGSATSPNTAQPGFL